MQVATQLTTSQAARVLGYSSMHTRRLAEAGRIPSTVTPLGRLFDADEIRVLAAERTARQQRRDSGN